MNDNKNAVSILIKCPNCVSLLTVRNFLILLCDFFSQPKYPIAHKRSQSKMLNEGMEALRQIATTSLFMQNEQKTAINRVVPIINEPESMDHMGGE